MSLLPYLHDIHRDFFGRGFFNNQLNQLMRPEVFGPRLMNPWGDISNSMDQLSTALNQLALNNQNTKITSDEEKFQVNVDVQHFAPNEVTVRVVDRSIIVEGKHEEKQDEHGYISRHFVRKYALPKECLPDTVESQLTADGVLVVTAPKYLPMPSPGERIVPIQHTGPVKKAIGAANE